MDNRHLIIKITNEALWFNEEDRIDIGNTNLPMDHMKFSYGRTILWRTRMDGFISKSNILRLEILEYKEIDIELFKSQKPKKIIEGVEFVTLENGEIFEWEKLEPQLSSYTKNKITKHESAGYESYQSKLTERVEARYVGPTRSRTPMSEDDELKLSFKVGFTDVKFILGGITLTHYVSRLSRNIEFTIPNPHLLPEFDHVKHWFAKRLNSKKIPVQAIVKTKGNEVVTAQATSSLINRIDEKLIQGVKVDRTLGLKKRLNTGSVDKSLFTADEFFESEFDKSDLGNVFRQTDQELIELLLENLEIRNRKELIYLSGKLHSKKHEIRFTNHPHFGFVFYVEGETECHFIWELLNTNATYVWSFDDQSGEISHRYERIQLILNLIMATGREDYKRAYRGKVQDQDLKFNIVNHENKNSNLVDGFPLWKHRISELMI